jgi:hypothetical protein
LLTKEAREMRLKAEKEAEEQAMREKEAAKQRAEEVTSGEELSGVLKAEEVKKRIQRPCGYFDVIVETHLPPMRSIRPLMN